MRFMDIIRRTPKGLEPMTLSEWQTFKGAKKVKFKKGKAYFYRITQ